MLNHSKPLRQRHGLSTAGFRVKGRREAGVVMRFHGVCGRLVAHPLHGDLPLGDTLVRNPHQSSKSTGLETPASFEKEGAVSWVGIFDAFCRERIAISINLIRLRATGSRSPARAVRIGGVGVREHGTSAPGPWDPSPRPRGSGPLSPAREAGGAEDRLWNSGHRDRFDRLL
jgi:hypothetical protein